MYLKKINKMKRTIKKSQLSAIHDELTVVVTSDWITVCKKNYDPNNKSDIWNHLI